MAKKFNIGAAINGVKTAQNMVGTKLNPRQSEVDLVKERLGEAELILEWMRDNRGLIASAFQQGAAQDG